jgi:hypothetical protein
MNGVPSETMKKQPRILVAALLSDCLFCQAYFCGEGGKKRVMEKMENDEAVSPLSHNPGYDYEGVIRLFLKQGGPLALWR